MKIIYLGQAGLLFENENIKIIIDPYLSDSVKKIEPDKYRRKPINEYFLNIKPDVIICTHNHADHFDKETIENYLNEESKIEVLSPYSVWQEIKNFGGNNNYILFNRHTEWSCKGIKFMAIKAEHSDKDAIGIIIDDGEKKYYITGDTLYNSEIFNDLPNDIYTIFLPINGTGNNMNMLDAERFSKKTKAKKVVPVHFGMLDEINVEEFKCRNKVIPEIYKEINL